MQEGSLNSSATFRRYVLERARDDDLVLSCVFCCCCSNAKIKIKNGVGLSENERPVVFFGPCRTFGLITREVFRQVKSSRDQFCGSRIFALE